MLRSATTLLDGLGGEKDRWSENAVVLNDSLVNVVGDVLLAGGCVAYLGCFTVDVSVNELYAPVATARTHAREQ